ncbi:VTT domain-containing protein [Candidatus Sumerlaeota bacterium]|nr:VTT domain-containing protein [Candidatus Sumerlaeota bacterium]
MLDYIIDKLPQYGIFLLFLIIFAETGILITFFLPGDSLLITVGMFANPEMPNHIKGLDIFHVNIALVLAAIIGDQLGFFLGTRVSDKIWDRPDGRLYKRKYMEEAHDFYVKHGALAIIGARFIPVMRTFVPFAAGVAKMPYRNFVFWNIVGGFVWVTGLLWAGYLLAKTPLVNSIDKVILVVIFVSILPLIIGVAKRWMKARRDAAAEAASK